MRNDLRFALIFAGVCVAGVYLHEIGHAVAGWVQGIPVFPTPAKEYVLQDQVEWRQKIWVSLGGVAGTALLVLGSLLWYARERRPVADAVLAGVLIVLQVTNNALFDRFFPGTTTVNVPAGFESR